MLTFHLVLKCLNTYTFVLFVVTRKMQWHKYDAILMQTIWYRNVKELLMPFIMGNLYSSFDVNKISYKVSTASCSRYELVLKKESKTGGSEPDLRAPIQRRAVML
jgi:beta-lactamase regulating signal transducer with metallopeptidase domain